MFLVYLDSTDISASVLECSPISYRVNRDFSVELPSIDMVLKSDLLEAGDRVTIREAADATKACQFVVKEVVYDYSTKKQSARLNHALDLLADIHTRSVPNRVTHPNWDDWSTITPGYDLLNYQYDFAQGQNMWKRRYIQALFLLKMLICRATGTSIESIDSSDIDDVNSFYYSRTYNIGTWVTTPLTYAELGVASESIGRLGNTAYDENRSDDFFVLTRQTNCLTLLNALLKALQITMNVFRSDYKLGLMATASAPADAAILSRTDSDLELWRRYRLAVRHLAETERNDYVYGLFDETYWPTPYWYTWGVDDPDVELVDRVEEYEDTSVDMVTTNSLEFPAHFRIYRIGVSTYDPPDSFIFAIADGETGDNELAMWLGEYVSQAASLRRRERYQIKAPGMVCYLPATTIDVAAKKLEYERMVT